MGVQYSLWGGSIVNLGTERHKKEYYERINNFTLPGKLQVFKTATMPADKTDRPVTLQVALP